MAKPALRLTSLRDPKLGDDLRRDLRELEQFTSNVADAQALADVEATTTSQTANITALDGEHFYFQIVGGSTTDYSFGNTLFKVKLRKAMTLNSFIAMMYDVTVPSGTRTFNVNVLKNGATAVTATRDYSGTALGRSDIESTGLAEAFAAEDELSISITQSGGTGNHGGALVTLYFTSVA